jgi:hypothetical protein
MYRILADLVVGLHLLFVVFVVAGGLLLLRWRRLAWIHIPTAVWGALIEFAGWVCPLTPLEQTLRQAAGDVGYRGGFIEHYMLPVLYPGGLTRGIQIGLGVVVLTLNLVIYGYLLRRWRRHPERSEGPGRRAPRSVE